MRRVLALPLLFLVACELAHAGGIVNPGTGGGTGATGAAGPSGPSGPTGPDWTTCAQMATGLSGATTGTCGSAVLSVAPAFTGAATADRLTLTSTSGSALTATAQNVASAYGVKGVGSGNSDSYAVWGQAGNGGVGVYALSNGSAGGYALMVGGDNSSPVKASIHIDTPDAQPTGANLVGDFYVTNTGTLTTVSAAGTPATWKSVSNSGILSTVAAAGTNQATATALAASADWVTVTAANGTTAITLPTGAVADCVRVMSQVILETSVLNVFGHNSDNDTINGGAADAVYAQKPGTSLVYCTADGTNWFTY